MNGEVFQMIQDCVKIRKGTEPTTAFKKVLSALWTYLLFNSRNLKTEKTLTITFTGGDTQDCKVTPRHRFVIARNMWREVMAEKQNEKDVYVEDADVDQIPLASTSSEWCIEHKRKS